MNFSTADLSLTRLFVFWKKTHPRSSETLPLVKWPCLVIEKTSRRHQKSSETPQQMGNALVVFDLFQNCSWRLVRYQLTRLDPERNFVLRSVVIRQEIPLNDTVCQGKHCDQQLAHMHFNILIVFSRVPTKGGSIHL